MRESRPRGPAPGSSAERPSMAATVACASRATSWRSRRLATVASIENKLVSKRPVARARRASPAARSSSIWTAGARPARCEPGDSA